MGIIKYYCEAKNGFYLLHYSDSDDYYSDEPILYKIICLYVEYATPIGSFGQFTYTQQ